MSNTAVIIQARFGSTRLPGKVMKTLCGKTVLEHDILRIRRAKHVDSIVIATSDLPADDAIAAEAKRLGVLCTRGSEQHVLSRYVLAAEEHSADTVIRITSDCPLYDPELLDKIIADFRATPCDYLSNCIERRYPRGLDTEIFTADALFKAGREATTPVEHEHVTPYINRNPGIFNLRHYHDANDTTDDSSMRWTLDTPEDWAFIKAVYEALYTEGGYFSTDDVKAYLREHPDTAAINAEIEQKAH